MKFSCQKPIRWLINGCLSIVALSVFFVSCRKEFDSNDLSNGAGQDEIVLFNRGDSKPFQLSKKSLSFAPQLMSSTSNSSSTNFEDYLGKSYVTHTGLYGEVSGFKIPIIDIDKLAKSADSIALRTHIPVRTSEAIYYSYSNFDRYEQTSIRTKKVAAGLGFKFLGFSIGAKYNYGKYFSQNIVNEDKSVFGELDVIVNDDLYELIVSENLLNKINQNYLHEYFIDELYNNHPSNFVKSYGGAVVTNFVTGGRASALYSANYSGSSDIQKEESGMNLAIGASYSFKKKADSSGVSLSFGMGKGRYDSVARTTSLANFSASLKTVGGKYGFSSFTAPKEIYDINIDFSKWAESLNDKSTHTIIDFGDNSIIPISAFIQEDNLKFNIDKYSNSSNDDVESLEEPHFIASIQPIGAGNPMGQVQIHMITRFGDFLTIKYGSVVDTRNEKDKILEILKNEAKEKQKFYNIKAISTDIDYFNRKSSSQYNFSIDLVDESSMKKWKDKKTNKLYLLGTSGKTKFAYVIFDDYLLDTYGMRTWVNGLESTNIQESDLKQYTKIAL